MSLRTRILVTAFAVMVAVLALLTINLAADALARARREQIRQGEMVAAWAQDWLSDNRERFASLAAGGEWAELARRLGRSSLVSDWVVAERVGPPDAAGGEGRLIPVPGATTPSAGAQREAWVPCLAQALQEARVVVRGPWVGAPLLDSERRVCGIALAVPLVGEATPDLGGTLARMAWVMLLGTALLLLVMYVLLHRFVLRPMEALLAGAERAARGDFNHPVPEPSSYDEMTKLVRAFNGMMERLAEHQRSLEADLDRARGRLTDTQRKLVTAQRLSSTGTLAAGVAHEINNPLGGLMNAARALQARADADPRTREYTGLILEGLERIQATVQRLLQFAPRPAGAPRPFALADAVARALALCEHRARERGVRVVNAVGHDLPLLQGDPGEVQQAVLNVVINALDAVAPGDGVVTLEARTEGGGDPPGAARVALTVTDNGAGMDAVALQRAADPFFTTKEPGRGTGLGLAVVQSILEHHGGTLGLSSEPGCGTGVVLSFPLGKNPTA